MQFLDSGLLVDEISSQETQPLTISCLVETMFD